MRTRKPLVAFCAGVIFALGLGLSGMTRPEKVTGFLDIFGAWDPSLAFVMLGAIAAFMPVALFHRRMSRVAPTGCGAADERDVPAWKDPSLVGGSLLFGIGWGLAGYCPGPALVSLVTGHVGTAAFVLAMAAGTLLAGWLTSRRDDRRVRASITTNATGHPVA